MTAAVETKALRKHFKKVKALNDFDISVPQGCCFGLLGPNGAGKSTLIKALLGIIHPSSGNATMMGKNILDISARRSVGYLPEGHRFPQYQTGRGILKYFGKLSGLSGAKLKSEIDEKLEMVRMTSRAKDRLSKYSKGMNQRIGIAQAMLGNPKLVFLDEPTDGIDPVGRKEIRDMIRNACDSGSTIFINSHILAELEMICDRVAIINRGDLILEGSLEEVRSTLKSQSDQIEVAFRTTPLGEEQQKMLLEYSPTIANENQFTVSLAGQSSVDQLVDQLRSWGSSIYEIQPVKENLEDAFIRIIEQHNQDNHSGNEAGGA